VAIIHAQRCDASGNTQIWGLLGVQKEAAFASRRVIVVVEELVDEAVIRSDPNRTVIPGMIVDAVVVEPHGAHPSYAQGYYDRDNSFYLEWDRISQDPAATGHWIEEWVHGVADRRGYLAKLLAREPGIWKRLEPGQAMAQPVNYGVYGEDVSPVSPAR
jgi:glutaconate CoA-transferase subunit A